MNKLFEENQKLVTYVLKKALKKFPHYFVTQNMADFRQVALIALWKASERFDRTKGFSFSTYAVPLIRGELFNCIEGIIRSRRKTECPEIVSLETPTVGGLTIGDLLPAPEKDDISWILEDTRLTDLQRNIVRLRYYGYSQDEIAEMVNVHQVTVSRNLKRIAEILNDDYKEKE